MKASMMTKVGRAGVAAGAILVLIGATQAMAGHRGGRGGWHHGPGTGHGPRVERMADELDLSQQQRDEIRQVMRRYKEGALGENLRAAGDARSELRRLVHDPAATEDRIRAAAREVGAWMEEVALVRHEMAGAIAEILTPVQQAKWAEFQERAAERRRSRQGGPGGDPWGD